MTWIYEYSVYQDLFVCIYALNFACSSIVTYIYDAIYYFERTIMFLLLTRNSFLSLFFLIKIAAQNDLV